jgi:hypothetical protein
MIRRSTEKEKGIRIKQPEARCARGDGIDQNPSTTILPRALPVSSSACARLRFAALMVPKCSATVVRILPASTSAAT